MTTDRPDETAAVDALSRFGLTTYEAKTFIALQKLGTATASEISDVSGVPRSQVYGATDGLEERGLIEVQQASPTRYRAVDLETARSQLLREFWSAGDRAFTYLEEIEGSERDREQRTESVWTVEGTEPITARCVELIDGATDRVIYATDDPGRLPSRLADRLAGRAAAGVAVIGVSTDPEVLERFETIEGGRIRRVSEAQRPELSTGRVLLVDRDAILLSVVDTRYLPDPTKETAIWGAETGFARVLAVLIEEWLQTTLTESE